MKRKKFHQYISGSISVLLLITALILAVFPLYAGYAGQEVFAAGTAGTSAAIAARGKINSADVCMRKSAKTSAKVITILARNTKVTIHGEVFKSSKSTAADKIWYYVTANDLTGYVRSDFVSNVKYNNTSAYTTDELNYRTGPSTTFKRLGTADSGTPVTVQLTAGRDSSSGWYRVNVNGTTAYMSAVYVSIGRLPEALTTPVSPVDLTGKSDLAKALLSKPTNGGRARYVYTFSSKNCTKLFSVKGYSGISTPQGLAYSGDRYYLLYGNSAGQRIVTYASNGKRITATRFAFAIGHPNGITWDPETGYCYVFKGHQKKIYTWHPGTNKFGKSKTPDNCSGGSYDASTGIIYGTSKPVLYAYTADGSFTLFKRIYRCSHGIKHSAQDCGAGGGFIFHCVSGANYRKTNFLDIYRVRDGKYMGSIKVKMGEVESAIVDSKGYVELLINHKGTTDYIWKTPLNINELS